MTTLRSDAQVAEELDEIVERLATLATQGGDAELLGRELGAIRAHLRVLAEENDEVRARLGSALA
ncbi:MAG TPA: hypothetical protein VGK79_00025 [Gaiellaceae bacterium]